METPSSSPAQPPAAAKKTILVKRVKVPVKHPVAQSGVPASAPVPSAQKKNVQVKVPVKTAKIPLKRPIAPLPVSPEVPRSPQSPSLPHEMTEAEKVASIIRKQPKPVIQSGASVPTRRESRILPPSEKEAISFTLPADPLKKINAQETIRRKFFLFYIYIRLYAEQVMDIDAYVNLPPMAFELPQTKTELKRFKKQLHSDAKDGLMDDILNDIALVLPLIPEFKRIFKRNVSLDDLIENEIIYMEENEEEASIGDQMVTAYLLIMAELNVLSQRAEIRKVRNERQIAVEEVQEIENEERQVQKAFVLALKKENFPVDADKLIRNYFNFAKKDAEKAYQILTTNPLFYSPIQLEKLPKKLFGTRKLGAKEATAINKKLASFLKKVKI